MKLLLLFLCCAAMGMEDQAKKTAPYLIPVHYKQPKWVVITEPAPTTPPLNTPESELEEEEVFVFKLED
jgi:hypothetical protein